MGLILKLFNTCLLLIWFFCSLLCYGQDPKITFNKIGSKEGLSQGHGIAILQDSEGFMWFGTRDGLNKWDGYKMKVYRNNPKDSTSLSNNDIVTLFEDRQKNLWIGTINGLNLFDRKTEKFKSFHHNSSDPRSISNNSIRSIYEDKAGNFWVGTYEGGLNKFDRKNTFTRVPASETASGTFTCFYEDRQNVLWIGTGNGIRRYDRNSGKFISFNTGETMSGDFVTSILEDHLGNFWVTTQGGGLKLFDRKTETFKYFLHNPNNPRSISNNNLYAVIEDLSGNVWIGSENGGLNLLERSDNSFRRYTNDQYDANSISSNTVSALYVDRSGLIWVGMHRGGINFFSTKAEKFKHFRTESHANSLSNNNIKPLFEDRNGNIWIGTDGGGLNKFNPETYSFEHFKHSPKNLKSLGADAVLGIAEEDESKLWIGTWDGGLNLLDTKSKTFKHYYHDPKDSTTVSSNNIWTIFKDTKGNIWIGTFGGGLCLYDRQKDNIQRITALKDGGDLLTNKNIFAINEDRSGNIWIGTQNGLNRYNPQTKEITHFLSDEKELSSLSSNYINTIYTDSKGRIWIGTQKGLNLFHPANNSFTLVGEKEGLGVISIQGILEDSKGNFWISTLKGLAQFHPEKKLLKMYTASDGLQGNEFSQNSTLKLKTGEMIFGGLNGLNIFNPDSLKNNPYIPPVYLTDFQIFNKPVEAGGMDSPLNTHISNTEKIVLSYKQSVFSFEFAALSYLASENNQYAYMLEGFEKEWNFVGHQRKATYTNLDAGEYTFKVKASNNDGIWNEEGTSIKLIITPPFWKTWWFKTFLAVFIIGGAISFYKIRMNAIKAQKAELEKQVQERTAEVVHQKEELQSQAENLQMANQELQEKQEEILQQTEEIMQQREQLEEQRDSLEITNNKIMSSINYAKSIQKAILPSEAKIHQAFEDHFVLYRPKDIVSGDFYWFSHIPKEELKGEHDNDLTFIASIDCTGHGVPGAFMSIIGNTLLNEIINLKHILDPAEILEQLDKGVKKAVDKAEGVNTAGMDVCLVRLEKTPGEKVKLLFGGAKRPLLYMLKGSTEVETLEGDRRSIGSELKVEKLFTTKELSVEQGVTLYMASDGYTDQNNPQREKLGTTKLKELITEVFNHPLTEQKRLFEKALDDHQQDAEQRDDITLLGVRI